MSSGYYARLPTAALVGHVHHEAVVPLYVIEQYLAGAETQMARVTEELQQARQRALARDPNWGRFHQQAFLDLHGYFTCWRQVGAMMKVVAEALGDPMVADVFEGHWPTLKRYRDARDHLEHFEERLRGRSRRGRLAIAGDLGNLVDGWYTFGGDRWDVTPASLGVLQAIVADFDASLRAYALEQLTGLKAAAAAT